MFATRYDERPTTQRKDIEHDKRTLSTRARIKTLAALSALPFVTNVYAHHSTATTADDVDERLVFFVPHADANATTSGGSAQCCMQSAPNEGPYKTVRHRDFLPLHFEIFIIIISIENESALRRLRAASGQSFATCEFTTLAGAYLYIAQAFGSPTDTPLNLYAQVIIYILV